MRKDQHWSEMVNTLSYTPSRVWQCSHCINQKVPTNVVVGKRGNHGCTAQVWPRSAAQGCGVRSNNTCKRGVPHACTTTRRAWGGRLPPSGHQHLASTWHHLGPPGHHLDTTWTPRGHHLAATWPPSIHLALHQLPPPCSPVATTLPNIGSTWLV